MPDASDSWKQRAAELWARLDEHDGDDFVRRMRVPVAELPPGTAAGLFELGGAFDSTGHPDRTATL